MATCSSHLKPRYVRFRAIDLFTQRIKWLLQGSKRIFGMVKGDRVGVLVDCSDSNFGFGRQTAFMEALMVGLQNNAQLDE